uniref:Uncharacterized protein n=1 Tax=Anas platyrhynchos platyrhynchos TaxID=8840 RepID=A0A493TUE6_ANAPP
PRRPHRTEALGQRPRMRDREGGGGGAMAGVFDIDLDQPEDAGSDEELEEG